MCCPPHVEEHIRFDPNRKLISLNHKFWQSFFCSNFFRYQLWRISYLHPALTHWGPAFWPCALFLVQLRDGDSRLFQQKPAFFYKIHHPIKNNVKSKKKILSIKEIYDQKINILTLILESRYAVKKYRI